LVYDKQTNKAAPVAADILHVDDISGGQLLANSHRFKVLRDIWVPCVGTAGPQAFYINEYVKCNLQTEYIDGAGAGTAADVTSGGLILLCYCNARILVDDINITSLARVRFTDA